MIVVVQRRKWCHKRFQDARMNIPTISAPHIQGCQCQRLPRLASYSNSRRTCPDEHPPATPFELLTLQAVFSPRLSSAFLLPPLGSPPGARSMVCGHRSNAASPWPFSRYTPRSVRSNQPYTFWRRMRPASGAAVRRSRGRAGPARNMAAHTRACCLYAVMIGWRDEPPADGSPLRLACSLSSRVRRC